MEKSSHEMDLDDWELLSDDGFLIDLHHYDQKGDIKKGLVSTNTRLVPNSNGVFDADYFICPSPKSGRIGGTMENLSDSKCVNQVIPIPIQLDQKGRKNIEEEEKVKEVIKVPIVEINSFATIMEFEKIKSQNLKSVGGGGDQEMMLSQVFFKKQKGNDIFDMKIDSPKAIKPQFDAGSIQFEEKEETDDPRSESKDHKISPKIGNDHQNKNNSYLDSKSNISTEVTKWEGNSGGINIWRWRLNGIGALCSMGVAAATICIFILGSHQKHKHHQQKLRFQICSADDHHKRIKQVVHHASKLNQAFQVARGVPATRAHVTFGGYYEGL